MPNRDEKVAQVEAALRQRFFPLVPQVDDPNRADWTPEQHDTDRLSRSLAAYALVGLCNIDEATAASGITDGRNDGGIDALFYDRTNNRLVLVQAKFKRRGTAPSQDEILKTINGLKALQNRRFDEFNEAIRNRLDEVEVALDTPSVQLVLAVTFVGDNLGPHVISDLNALQAEMNRLNHRMSWQTAGLSQIHEWLVAEQTPATANAQIVLENWAAITEPVKAVYGQLSVISLAELVQEHGTALFERNIRHYLGSVGVNVSIEETVRRRPRDFFYLNNGITAIAETVEQAGGNETRCVFGLKNVSIVNGAQTAGAIANAAMSGTLSAEAKMLITIIETGAEGDSLSKRITRARNHQNAIRGVDFAGLDPNQERLRRELALASITYHYRSSAEARVKRDDAFVIEEAALAIACLSFKILTSDQIRDRKSRGQSIDNAIEYVVTAKKAIGRLWEQEGTLYGRLFPSTLSGVRMCRLVQIYRLIDQILADTERSENSYFRRVFFRHGRYFIMAFVGHCLPDITNRSNLFLSEPDEASLSLCINELSELIYAESESLQGIKGYLSIFRNLSDSQPLADRVLRRLDQSEPTSTLQNP